MRKRAVALALLAALALAGCSSAVEGGTGEGGPQTDSAAMSAELLSDHGLEDMDAPQIVEHLDTMPVADRPADLIASVHPSGVFLSDDEGREAAVPIEGEDVYVSVAPFVSETHDCFFHSLTTCLGELRNAEVHVVITDPASGETLVDETRTTYDNGFTGFWLPRGSELQITVEHNGKSGTTALLTGDDDPTCITTLQLA